MTDDVPAMRSLMGSLIREAGKTLLIHFRESDESLRKRTSAKQAVTR